MTWRRPILAALALAALVAVYAGGAWWKHHAAAREEARERLLPQDRADAVRIDIENGEERITLALEDGAWQLTEPLADAADQAQVSLLLQILDSALTLNPFRPERLEIYGLNEPDVAVRITFKDGESARLLLGGEAPQPQKIYAMLDGKNEVFLINRAVRQNLEKSVFFFRTKTILDAPLESVTIIRLENAGGVMEARRGEPGGPWRLVWPLDYPADGERLDGLLRRLSLNKILEYVDPNDAPTTATTWYDKPAAALNITWRPPLGGEEQTATLAAGPRHEAATAWYARRSGRDDLVLIGAEIMEELLRAPDQFRDKRLFSLRPSEVTRVDMTLGKETYAVERNSKGEWVFADDSLTPVFQRAADLFIENLLSLNAENFVTDAPGALADFGLDPPRLTASIHGAAESMEGMSIGAISPDKSVVYVMKHNENAVLGLKWTTLSTIYKFRIDLTDRRLLDPQAVSEDVALIITTEQGVTRILERRGDKYFMKSGTGETLGEVSPISALDYLTRFATLQYYRRVPVGEVAAKDAGLDTPVLSVRLEDAQGRAVAAMEFGSMMDDKIFMRLDGGAFYLMKLDDWKDLTTLYRRLWK